MMTPTGCTHTCNQGRVCECALESVALTWPEVIWLALACAGLIGITLLVELALWMLGDYLLHLWGWL